MSVIKNKKKEYIQKQKRKWTIKIIFLFSFFITSSLIVIYFLSPLSVINNVEVRGAKAVGEQTIIDASLIKADQPLWETLFKKKEIENEIIDEIEQISSANLTIEKFNNIIIKANEFETVAYLEKDNSYHKVLENGVIVKKSEIVTHGNDPILKNLSEGEVLDRLIQEIQSLESGSEKYISEIDLVDDDNNDRLVEVIMNDGNIVIASIPRFSNKMSYYPEMKESVGNIQGVFDLEVGAYFTPFEAEEDIIEENLIEN
ncbi:cell division protein FtsQ/DivIB [Lacticigenium naphthae]|uniref:cell division protein FtsQ/DivIB n=1 Tax=Lacticigenium naphthae TaxID=515351 RepID=UPI000426437E|nr:cell division protein FtsQ/DivIB [Lacticigenium naphthae]